MKKTNEEKSLVIPAEPIQNSLEQSTSNLYIRPLPESTLLPPNP